MSDETNTTFPELPCEVWRGNVAACQGVLCATTREGLQLKAWAWLGGAWKSIRYADMYGWGAAIFAAYAEAMRERAEKAEARYQKRHSQTIEALDNGDAFADAAESWKARAEKAEAIAKAERELRKALEPRSLRDDDTQRAAAAQRLLAAIAALRDLGVDP